MHEDNSFHVHVIYWNSKHTFIRVNYYSLFIIYFDCYFIEILRGLRYTGSCFLQCNAITASLLSNPLLLLTFEQMLPIQKPWT